jgi:glutaredoxin
MKKATLYRMVMPNHICPFGTKAKYLLKKQGYEIDDHHLKSKEETESFKHEHQVKTTPQTFIEGKRIGGYDDLRVFFHKNPAPKKGELSYAPIFSLFGMTFLMSLGIVWSIHQTLAAGPILHYFGALSMCALAIQKLRDLFSFSNGFLNYDLLSNKYVPYSYIYPFAEVIVGLAMLANLLPMLSGPVAIFIGLEGTVSVLKAVYIDKRELKCACMGGDSNVPLGFISLSENLLMVAMGAWGLFSI